MVSWSKIKSQSFRNTFRLWVCDLGPGLMALWSCWGFVHHFIFITGLSGQPWLCVCSITWAAPLGGDEELCVQQLASCRGSEPQTLGKQHFVHIRLQSIRFPLPPSFSDLRDITERAVASLPFLIRSSACCQCFYPAGHWSISLFSDETNRWMTGGKSAVANGRSSHDNSARTALDTYWQLVQTMHCQSWCTIHLGKPQINVTVPTYSKYIGVAVSPVPH